MMHTELVNALATIKHALDNRVEIWHVIIDERGVETGQRIYAGCFFRQPGSHVGDPPIGDTPIGDTPIGDTPTQETRP